MNQLEQLKQFTEVVADTGDINAIKAFQPTDATTNPSLLLKAAQLTEYQELLSKAKAWGQQQGGSEQQQLDNMAAYFAVQIGTEILKIIPGLISTEVDARLSFNTEETVAKAQQIIQLYSQQGVSKERVLIKMAATWEGIQAAKILKQKGINSNLTLIFNLTQAIACAEANAYLISPFTGRILDWHKKQNPDADYQAKNDPGVQSVSAIYNYFKSHAFDTIVMGASFRNIGEIQALAGCDRLTIAPALMQELSETNTELNRQLTAEQTTLPTKPPITETEFRWQLNADAMATEKLADGIRSFTADQLTLEALLSV